MKRYPTDTHVGNYGRERKKRHDDDDEYVGRFWGIIETRPYMRVLQAIVRLAFENKDFNKSA